MPKPDNSKNILPALKYYYMTDNSLVKSFLNLENLLYMMMNTYELIREKIFEKYCGMFLFGMLQFLFISHLIHTIYTFIYL